MCKNTDRSVSSSNIAQPWYCCANIKRLEQAGYLRSKDVANISIDCAQLFSTKCCSDKQNTQRIPQGPQVKGSRRAQCLITDHSANQGAVVGSLSQHGGRVMPANDTLLQAMCAGPGNDNLLDAAKRGDLGYAWSAERHTDPHQFAGRCHVAGWVEKLDPETAVSCVLFN
jgi:hypothetical protein